MFSFNSIKQQIFTLSQSKAFLVDIINVTEKMKFVLGGVENSVRKGGNAGYQHFLLSPLCFQKVYS